MRKMKPCILCGSGWLYAVEDVDRFDIIRHGIFCNSCKTTFSNEHFEDTEDETIEWWNRLKRGES